MTLVDVINEMIRTDELYSVTAEEIAAMYHHDPEEVEQVISTLLRD